MIKSQLFIKKIMLMCVGVFLMTILVTSAHAEDRVVRNHSITLDDIQEMEISNSVGRIDLVQTEVDQIRVVLEIEGKKKGFFRRSVDVEDMDLEIKQRGGTLFLSFDEKNTNAEWTVEMPSVERTIIQMGVGEIVLDISDTDLDVELGVGDVNINAQEQRVGRINLNVGVGDARIRGGEVLDSESAFISKSIRAQGSGDKDLEVDLGVGDVSIRLN